MDTRSPFRRALAVAITLVLWTGWPLLAFGQDHSDHSPRVAVAAALDTNMTILPLQTTIGPGPDTQTVPLFKGPRRTLVQITLRNGATLSAHKAAVPITIHCVAGSGTLTVAGRESPLALAPGVLVTLEPGVVHEVVASPAVSILLTQFTER